MHLTLTYENIIRYLQIGVDILVCWIVLNYLIKVVRTNQKTIQLFQGVILLVLVQAIAKLLGLTTIEWLTDSIVSWGFLAIIVIFQPEIRQILERIGKSNAFARISTLTSSEKETLIDELMAATANLAASKTGALITLEQSHSLNDYINTGIKLNSTVSAELLCSIFQTTTPLHDGAIIIQGDKMACASAYFPPTTMDLPSKYGARHRAAIGISEITDSVTIVVSEETGRVCVAEGGKLIQMNEKKLREHLNKVILNKDNSTGDSFKAVSSTSSSVEALLKKAESVASGATEIENELEKMNSSHQMKVFQTSSFTTSELAEAERQYLNEKRLVDEVVAKAVSDNSVDDSIKLKTVSVAKDTISQEVIKNAAQPKVEEPVKPVQVTQPEYQLMDEEPAAEETEAVKIFTIEDEEAPVEATEPMMFAIEDDEEAVVETEQSVVENAEETAEEIMSEAVESVEEITEEVVEETSETAQETVEKAVDEINEEDEEVTEEISETVETVAEEISETEQQAAEEVEQLTVAEEETAQILQDSEAVEEEAESIVEEDVDEREESIVETVEEAVEEIVDESVDSVEEIVDESVESVEEMSEEIVDETVETAQESVEDTVSEICDVVEEATEEINDIVEEITEEISETEESVEEVQQQSEQEKPYSYQPGESEPVVIKNVIKTTSVTTGTDKIETVCEENNEQEDGING